MLNDNLYVFDEARDLTTTAISTNVKTTVASAADFIDLGTGSPPMAGLIQLGAAIAGATSVEFQFVSASNNTLTTSLRTHWRSGVITIASAVLVAGFRIPFFLPPNGGSAGAYQQFVGYRYEIVGTVSGNQGAVTSLLGVAHPDTHTRRIFDHGQAWS